MSNGKITGQFKDDEINEEALVVAAAVLGGTSMSGVSSFWQMVIKGMVIVLVVIADQVQRNFQNKVTLAKK